MKTAFVYVTDQRGYNLAKHSAISVALSQPGPGDIHIFCYRFLPEPSSNLLAILTEQGMRLYVHDISDPQLEAHEALGHVTTPTLLKLTAVAAIVGQYDVVTYLDNDILVMQDLRLDQIEFGSSPIAAVLDMDLSTTGVMRESVWAGGTAIESDYFNAGFMVFAARNWRGPEFLAAYAAALDQHDIGCCYKLRCTSIDQCALNSVFARHWVRRPLTYNMQASAKFTDLWQRASVRHYCGTSKFLPFALFRNDGRDVRYLNRIRRAMDLPGRPFPWLYAALFDLNAFRHRNYGKQMERFLQDVETADDVPVKAA